MQEAAKKTGLRYEDLSIFEKGVRRQIHDDITVIVIYFDHPLKFSKVRTSDSTPLLSHSIAPVDVALYNTGALDFILDESSC